VPSIVIGDGRFSPPQAEKPTIRAIRTGGEGDITQTHIAWEQTKGVPSVLLSLSFRSSVCHYRCRRSNLLRGQYR
jgi:hypothetical protein